MTKPYDLLTLGEILLRLSPSPEERLSSGDFFRKSVGGAELNVAAGASLLGLRTGILSKIPGVKHWLDLSRICLQKKLLHTCATAFFF